MVGGVGDIDGGIELPHKSTEGQFVLSPPCDSRGVAEIVGLCGSSAGLAGRCSSVLSCYQLVQNPLWQHSWKIPELISELPHCLLTKVLVQIIKRAPKQLVKAYFFQGDDL